MLGIMTLYDLNIEENCYMNEKLKKPFNPIKPKEKFKILNLKKYIENRKNLFKEEDKKRIIEIKKQIKFNNEHIKIYEIDKNWHKRRIFLVDNIRYYSELNRLNEKFWQKRK